MNPQNKHLPKLNRREGIERAERIAYWLDEAGRIPLTNIRIGLDPIIGAVPWLGDTVTAGLSIYLLGTAVHYKLPKLVILRMALNVAIDFVLGVIPYVGDAADFIVKSNRRNVRLLREYAGERVQPSMGDWLFVGSLMVLLLLLLAGSIGLSIWLFSKGWRWFWQNQN